MGDRYFNNRYSGCSDSYRIWQQGGLRHENTDF